ncbi:hypothetical protein RIR_jg27971.t1 [Rhizophagus irregularis DAOM 181602=DAOM 197198]|nr:hypothetical protein RIR_jg27971.t1 [Rhizophagus irregularis DAOM 181602=DAOM 197198]
MKKHATVHFLTIKVTTRKDLQQFSDDLPACSNPIIFSFLLNRWWIFYQDRCHPCPAHLLATFEKLIPQLYMGFGSYLLSRVTVLNVGQIPHELFTILIICSSVQKNSHVKSQNVIHIIYTLPTRFIPRRLQKIYFDK